MMLKTIKLSVLALALLSGTAMQAYAQDTGVIDFKPVRAWSVGPAQKKAGDGFCVMQNEYDNGFIVGLSGAAATPYKSLDIDFRQSAFEEGENYEVSLAVPGSGMKKLPGRATNPSTLSVSLPGADVFAGLRAASAFDVGVEGNSFRFQLTGFADAATSFENCLSGQAEPPQAKIVAAAPEAPAEVKPVLAPLSVPPATSKEMVNESIALEQAETQKAAIIEIDPENPRPVAQPIPVIEKTKLGDMELTPAETKVLDNQGLQGRKRMSEQLAEKIAKNPAMADWKEPANMSPAQEKQQAAQKKEAAMKEAVEDTIKSPPQAAAAQASGKPEDLVYSPGIGKVVPESELTTASLNRAAAPTANPQQKPPETPPETPKENPKDGIVFNDPPAAAKAPVPLTKSAAEPTAVPVQPEKTVMSKNTPEMKIVRQTAKLEADFTDSGNAATPDSNAPFSRDYAKADPEMIRKVSELESMVAELKKENMSLNDELKSTLTETKQEHVSISSDNWNLERATMRYNEAERELKRMGQQLQQARAQCAVEKQDLEAQLFDPQVTSQQQLAHLADLEQKLAAAQQQVEDQRLRYEERIRILESQKATQ